jgi:hypothetical protein
MSLHGIVALRRFELEPKGARELRFRDQQEANIHLPRMGKCGQGQNRTADTRIFSPHIVPRLCVTIGHQMNEFNSFCWLRCETIDRFEHIVAYSSGKVVAKSALVP